MSLYHLNFKFRSADTHIGKTLSWVDFDCKDADGARAHAASLFQDLVTEMMTPGSAAHSDFLSYCQSCDCESAFVEYTLYSRNYRILSFNFHKFLIL